jgi:hypothetical protein
MALHPVRLYNLEVQCVFCDEETVLTFVRFEVFTMVTMKNAIFWDVMPFLQGSYKSHMA